MERDDLRELDLTRLQQGYSCQWELLEDLCFVLLNVVWISCFARKRLKKPLVKAPFVLIWLAIYDEAY